MAPGSPCSEIDKTQGDLAASGNYFVVDPAFLATASMQPYQRTQQDPLHRPLRIDMLDPTASRLDGAVAMVNVPFERLRSGPVPASWKCSIGTKRPGSSTSRWTWMILVS